MTANLQQKQIAQKYTEHYVFQCKWNSLVRTSLAREYTKPIEIDNRWLMLYLIYHTNAFYNTFLFKVLYLFI